MSTAWRYPDETSTTTIPSTSFLTHLCSINFHRRIVCPRTSSAVTFSVVGDLSSIHTVLYCLPSGCSRYLAFFLDGICRLVGVKLIAIDRPGSGGTTACPLESRMYISLCHSISVLQSEGLIDDQLRLQHGQRPVAVLAHSAGFLYALNLLQHFSQLSSSLDSPSCPFPSPFGKTPLLLLSSPWIPTSISRSSLALVPASVIRLSTTVIPGIGKAMGMAMGSYGATQDTAKSWLGWSAGIVTKGDEEQTQSRRTYAVVSMHPDTTTTATTVEGIRSPATMAPPITTTLPNPFLSSVGSEPPASPTSLKGKRIRKEAKKKWPSAYFLPPHESHHKYTLHKRVYSEPTEEDPPLLHPSSGRPLHLSVASGSRILMEMMNHESRSGMTEDFLLSLGHAPSLGNPQLESLIVEGVESLKRTNGGADVLCVWAMGDRLVPQRGRDWLHQLFQMQQHCPTGSSRGGEMRYEELIMADAGHDATMSSEAVVVELLSRVKESGSARATRCKRSSVSGRGVKDVDTIKKLRDAALV